MTSEAEGQQGPAPINVQNQPAIAVQGQPARMVPSKTSFPAPNLAFPMRLFAMLEEGNKRGFDHIIAWQPGGESFRVFKPDRFEAEVAAEFFALRKYKSFLRQLNIYG